jgi:hypothetical protein
MPLNNGVCVILCWHAIGFVWPVMPFGIPSRLYACSHAFLVLMRAGALPPITLHLQDAKAKLLGLVDLLREIDNSIPGGGMTAAADMLLLYASTRFWITGTLSYLQSTTPLSILNISWSTDS